MGRKIVVGLALSVALIAGCNKDSDTAPAAPATEPTVVPLTSIPTTQQLLTGPRTTLDLKYAPFTLNVPVGWATKTFSDGAAVIEGQTPTDTVGVSIAVYRTITEDQEKSLEAHAKQDLIDHPDLMKAPTSRDIPGARMIEQLILDAPAIPSAATQPLQTLQWTFTLCIPNGKDFTAYDLRFVGLTVQQYKTDQAFLRSIMDTIAYVPPAADPAVK